MHARLLYSDEDDDDDASGLWAVRAGDDAEDEGAEGPGTQHSLADPYHDLYAGLALGPSSMDDESYQEVTVEWWECCGLSRGEWLSRFGFWVLVLGFGLVVSARACCMFVSLFSSYFALLEHV